MLKKFLFTTGVILVGVLGVSCVSPFYGTARIEKGWGMDAGVAGMAVLCPCLDAWGFNRSFGGRADAELRYGFNEYLQIHGRIALGLACWPVFADGGLGIQAALPLGPVTPALRAEVSGYGGGVTISPAFLLGIGRKEKVTLGGRVHIFGNAGDEPHPEYGPYLEDIPTDIFIGVHLGRWNIFAGSQFVYHSDLYSNSYWDRGHSPVASIGIGYKLK